MAAALAELNNWLTALNFPQAQHQALNNQGIDSLNTLHDMDPEELTTTCTMIHHPGGMITNPAGGPDIPNHGTVINTLLEIHLLLASYYLHHLQCTQRTFVLTTAMAGQLNQLKLIHQRETTIHTAQNDYTKPEKFKGSSMAYMFIDEIKAYLAKTHGECGVPMSYLVHDDEALPNGANPSNEYPSVEAKMIHHAPLTGPVYEMDNTTLWQLLRELIYDTDAWPWIAAFKGTMNGHAAFIAFCEHYLGCTESNAQIAKAENNIRNLHYAGNHHNFTLETYTDHLKQYFTNIYNADHASAYMQDKQVYCLCTGICMAILKPATGIILSNATYHNNFDNAMAFLHEYITLNIPKTHLDSTGRGGHGGGHEVSAETGHGHGGGHGGHSGHFGGHGGDGGRDGRGRGHGHG